MTDYFAILGLTPRASDREIREAYRRLAKRYHPDAGSTAEATRMQQINDAKEVLFDPVRREEHRVMLGLGERLSTSHIEALRNDPRFQHTSRYRGPAERSPRSVWDKKWRRYFVGIVTVAALVTIIISTYEYLTGRAAEHSVHDVIAYYQRIEPVYLDSSKFDLDTASLADDSAVKLKRKGDIFFGLGEYRSAARYYEKYLQHVPHDDTVLRNLSYAFFRKGQYAEALEVLSRQMQGDSNLVIAYYNIGQMFLADGKPFDARDAFTESVHIADSMRRTGRTPPNYEHWARTALARLE